MNDKYLKQFRKAPRPEFAAALHARLAQQAAADLRPATPTTDGRKGSETQEDTEMNARLSIAALPRRPTRRREGQLVALVATVATLLFGALLVFNTLHNGKVPLGLYQQAADTPTALFERYINQAWNAGDTRILGDLLAADHMCYKPGMTDGVAGIEPVAEMIANYRTAFPDWQFTVENLVATEDAVWARLVGTGTQTGPFAYADGVTVDATGRRVTLDVMISARLANGKISEQRFQFDALELLGQLQAVGSPNAYLTEQRNMELTRQWFDAYNQHDPVTAVGFITDPMKIHPYANRPTLYMDEASRDGGAGFLRALWFSFPDMQVSITHMAAAGDIVFAEVSVRGTFDYPISPYWADIGLSTNHEAIIGSQQEETWTWLFVLRYDEDGLIAEMWWYVDWPWETR